MTSIVCIRVTAFKMVDQSKNGFFTLKIPEYRGEKIISFFSGEDTSASLTGDHATKRQRNEGDEREYDFLCAEHIKNPDCDPRWPCHICGH